MGGCKMGDTCAAYGDECPYNCPHVPFNDCASQGMQNCPGPMDQMGMGCMTADTCIPHDETCPFYCPYVPPMECGEGMTRWDARWEIPVLLMEMNVPTTAPMFPSMTAQHRGCRTALDQWTRWEWDV